MSGKSASRWEPGLGRDVAAACAAIREEFLTAHFPHPMNSAGAPVRHHGRSVTLARSTAALSRPNTLHGPFVPVQHAANASQRVAGRQSARSACHCGARQRAFQRQQLPDTGQPSGRPEGKALDQRHGGARQQSPDSGQPAGRRATWPACALVACAELFVLFASGVPLNGDGSRILQRDGLDWQDGLIRSTPALSDGSPTK